MNDSTDRMSEDFVGKIVLSYHSHNASEPVIINIPNVENRKFLTIAQNIAVEVKNDHKAVFSSNLNSAVSDNVLPGSYATVVGNDVLAGQSTSDTEEPEADATQKEGDLMSDFSRSELQAHLKSNKSEIDVVAASMKKDMAEWREQMRADLRDVKDAVNSQKSSLDQHINAQKTQLDAHMQLQKMLIEKEFSAQSLKLDTSIKLQTAGLQESLSAVKLDVTRWVVGLILGVPSILFTVYKIIEAVSVHKVVQ